MGFKFEILETYSLKFSENWHTQILRNHPKKLDDHIHHEENQNLKPPEKKEPQKKKTKIDEEKKELCNSHQKQSSGWRMESM